ncbi:hypothetical protein [Pseudomarimonas arenosa]|uniref:Lipoprotein n=1 Tax=Pseudomarimonas arenosa TaxID=2774145 RepID=A0AAW3ZIV3_9GAMM|nr:hypothetical protein [Pseudomarimonas arenosa]MBD8524617.1 hypothetical protein [Pseudomarimonas arenosa]
MKTSLLPATTLATAFLLAACGQSNAPSPTTAAPAVAEQPTVEPTVQAVDTFLDAIRQHCGRAYVGRIIADQPPPNGDDPFVGKSLIMHVRSCDDAELRIPFHVGEDRSRTWVLTRTQTGLRLKHDHRHEDGSPDATTLYGGDTASAGTTSRQEFPVDAESIALFEAEGRNVSTTNTWAMEIEPGKRFLYELSRPGGRLFQVEFDLTQPIDPPPAPWGAE